MINYPVGISSLPISVTLGDELIPQAKIIHSSLKISNFSREEFLAANPEEQQQMLENYLLSCVSSSLQLPLKIHREQSFTLLLDSLIAILLKSKIEEDLHVRISLEQFFGACNIVQLAQVLRNQLEPIRKKSVSG
jgi:3-oxoacyl-[acyl-carrier-protein] synthase-3